MSALVIGEYFIRIIIAGICGGIIGYERKNRGKEAGIRTHIIVAIASALMMIISKYGFGDLPYGNDFKFDPSRVASQIISGVGFLGAGMIFVEHRAVKGLTTAAGIWATSGIGMAIGSGLYTIGILTSMLIVVTQIILHRNIKFLQPQTEEQFTAVIYDTTEAIEYFKNYLAQNGITVLSFESKKKNDEITLVCEAVIPQSFDILKFIGINSQYVKSINI